MTLFDRLKQLLEGSQAPLPPSGDDEESSAACKTITCMEAIARVHEYLDGELDGISHEEVAHHFSMCQRCYPHLRLEERFRELLQRSQEGDACPESLRERVLDLLAAEAGEPR